jgi:hypothetical protein
VYSISIHVIKAPGPPARIGGPCPATPTLSDYLRTACPIAHDQAREEVFSDLHASGMVSQQRVKKVFGLCSAHERQFTVAGERLDVEAKLPHAPAAVVIRADLASSMPSLQNQR